MADGDKTFTEAEHTAILADRVATETAALTAQVTSLTAEKADLETKLDVAESAKLAVETEKAALVTEFETFKTEVTEREAAAERKDTRIAAVKEVAAHLGDDYFEDEARVTRIVAMDEDSFAAYSADLAATAPKGTTTPGTTPPPRETAMTGGGSTGATGAKPTAATKVLLGRAGLVTASQEG